MGNKKSKADEKGIKTVSSGVEDTIKKFKSDLKKIKDSMEEIKGEAEKVRDYDDSIVAGSLKSHMIMGENDSKVFVYDYKRINTKNYMDVITSANNVITSVDAVLGKLNDTDDYFGKNINKIADAIADAESKINKSISDDVRKKALLALFADGLSSNEYDAKNREFIKPENIHGYDSWKGIISFERQSNGTYLIYKTDDKGNKIPMGFTTAQGKRSYYDSIAKSEGVKKSASDNKEIKLGNKTYKRDKYGFWHDEDGSSEPISDADMKKIKEIDDAARNGKPGVDSLSLGDDKSNSASNSGTDDITAKYVSDKKITYVHPEDAKHYTFKDKDGNNIVTISEKRWNNPSGGIGSTEDISFNTSNKDIKISTEKYKLTDLAEEVNANVDNKVMNVHKVTYKDKTIGYVPADKFDKLTHDNGLFNNTEFYKTLKDAASNNK